MTPRKVVVTGGEGFVGRRLVVRLRALCHDVRSCGHRTDLDVTDAAVVRAQIDAADVIIHLAALTFVPDSFQHPDAFFSTNVLGTINMLEAARRVGAKFILASAFVYGPAAVLPIQESQALLSHSPYTESKILSEQVFRHYHRMFGVQGSILRAFNIYGPGQDSRFLIPTLLAQAKEGRLTVGSGRPRRDFVYVDDVVEAYVRAVELPPGAPEAYNIASGESVSVAELIELVQSFHGSPLTVNFTERERPHEIPDTRADISRARRDLHWAPTISLREGLQRTMTAFFQE